VTGRQEGAEVTCWGKLFRMRAAATGEARSRRWIVECGRRSVMKTRQNGVADEPQRPPLDTVHRRDMTVQRVSHNTKPNANINCWNSGPLE